MSDQSKQRYRGPEIVDVGDVETITTQGGEPVRDNPNVEPPQWYNANPPGTRAPEDFDSEQ